MKSCATTVAIRPGTMKPGRPVDSDKWTGCLHPPVPMSQPIEELFPGDPLEKSHAQPRQEPGQRREQEHCVCRTQPRCPHSPC